MTRTWALAIASAVLIVGIVLLANPRTPPEETVELPDELAGEPDLYMQDAVITQFQPNGTVKYKLASDQIRHFDRDNLTRLAVPRLTLHNDTQPPWQVESDHGYIRRGSQTSERGEVVYLRQDVTLEQRYPDGRHLRLEAPSMYIYPDREYAETEQNVMIDTDVGRTTAVGMRGDLKRGLLNLSSSAQRRVHTIVLPGQFK